MGKWASKERDVGEDQNKESSQDSKDSKDKENGQDKEDKRNRHIQGGIGPQRQPASLNKVCAEAKAIIKRMEELE